MRLAGALLLAVSVSVQANAQVPGSSAREFIELVRTEIGEDAGAPECFGQFQQTCTIRLGRSFILTTEATTAGELVSVKLAHNEIAAEPPEKAAGYVSALCDVLAGEHVDAVTDLLSEAVQSNTATEKVVNGVLYRADTGSDVFLEARPAP